MQSEIDRISNIQKILKTTYPDVKTQLDHNSPFQLLVATILSAQCTDIQVNKVTRTLFRELPTADKFAGVPLEKLEKLIHSTGFYRNKAKNIKTCAAVLMDRYNGQVPGSMEELVGLPGVGRKTANVVLGAAFGIPGMVVDTHVARISQRLGLTVHKDPAKIESDLMALIPEENWSLFSLQLVYFGRETCRARKPLCPNCPLNADCPYPDKS